MSMINHCLESSPKTEMIFQNLGITAVKVAAFATMLDLSKATRQDGVPFIFFRRVSKSCLPFFKDFLLIILVFINSGNRSNPCDFKP